MLRKMSSIPTVALTVLSVPTFILTLYNCTNIWTNSQSMVVQITYTDIRVQSSHGKMYKKMCI